MSSPDDAPSRGAGDEASGGVRDEARNRAKGEAREEAERKRRLAEVFGDVLPETTSDERDPEESREETARDTWIRDQVPPHH